jgi:hypothetical protein
MAYLSWRFIERTVRINQQLFTRRRLFIATGIGASIFAGWAVLVTKLEGLPTRFSPAALVIADGAEDRNPNTDICDGKSGSEITAGPVCTIGQRIAPITFALIGDSYANALSPGVGDAASKAGRRGLVMTHSGCYALIGINWGSSDPDCKEFLHAAIQKLKATPSINTVILISRWTVAAEGTRFSADHPDRLFIVDDQSKEQGYDENKAVFTRSLKRDANALAGYKVFVLGFVPEQLMYISQSGAMRTQLGLRPDDVVTPRQTVEQRQADIRQLLSAASVQYGFRILDAMAPLCDDKMCHAIENGKSLYTDDNHLSRYGALMESTVLQSAFN